MTAPFDDLEELGESLPDFYATGRSSPESPIVTSPAQIQGRLMEIGQEQLTRDDYYTPRAVFAALGLHFDLDVCAPPGGVEWVPCDHFYTLAEDGLTQPWFGRVWMNPPYSQVTPWAQRFIEHGHGIALLSHAKSAWHPDLWAAADAVAFPFRYFDFVGGSVPLPVWFAAFGEECVDALHRVGVVRVRSDNGCDAGASSATHGEAGP